MTHPAHHFLLDLGYTHTHIEAYWEDVGGPESGPKVTGHNGYDQYENGNEFIYITPEGEAHYEQFDDNGYPIKGSSW